MTDILPLTGRIALVTGASRGLGEAVALELAQAGAHVIALARTEGALEALEKKIESTGGKSTMVPFDLLELDRIDDLGAVIFEQFGKLDILVGNAAILGPLSPLGHIQAKEWNKVIDTNLNANWRLLRIFDPLLQRSDAGRVVFVTCDAATSHQAYWGPYAVSKAGLECMAKTTAAENQTTNTNINLFNPGVMQTALRMKAFPGEDRDTLPPCNEVAAQLVPLCHPEFTGNGEVVKAKIAG